MRDLVEILEDLIKDTDDEKKKLSRLERFEQFNDTTHGLISKLALELEPLVVYQIACSAITALTIHHSVMAKQMEDTFNFVLSQVEEDKYDKRIADIADSMKMPMRRVALGLMVASGDSLKKLEFDKSKLGEILSRMTEIDCSYALPSVELIEELIEHTHNEALATFRKKMEKEEKSK
jgi:hypothetical protein